MSNTLELSQSKVYINKYLIAFIALFMIPISGLSIDIYIPSLPAVSQYFGVEKALAQLSITMYMVGLGIMQLFAGGITDSFGRKKLLSFAMVGFIFATILIPLSHNIYQLLGLRLIQGLAIALAVVPIRTVISDVFEGREFFKMVNYMTMAWSTGPIIAPAIGGYLQHLFGWQACFYFLAAYSMIGLSLVLLFLPETIRYKHPFHIASILKRYSCIFFHREFLTGLSLNGLLYSIVILFAATGPFLIQNVMHYSPVQFGRVALIMGLAWFLGAMTSRFLIDISYQIKATFCFWSMLVIALISVAITLVLPLSIYSIVIPVFFLFWIGGILFPEHFSKAVSLFPKVNGSAGSLFASFVFFIPAVISGLGTFLKSSSALPLMLTYLGLIAMCLIIYYLGRNNHTQNQRIN